MPPERSNPLHNFTLPHLKWGNQKFLRCMKLNNTDHRPSSASESKSTGVKRSRAGNEILKRRSSDANETFKKPPLKPIAADNDKDGIEAVREKLMLDLRVAADKMKISILEEKYREFEESNSVRPWNLRTRRAACKAPNESGVGNGKGLNCNLSSSSPLRPESPTVQSSRLKGLASVAAAATTTGKQSVEKSQGPTLSVSVSLSRDEIESDFLAMVGIRPPRRPKKRPKTVQKQLDSIFPGTWLTEITAERYKVPEEGLEMKA